MIVFDLRCRAGHVFEAWFASGDAYEQQRRAGHVACPICGDDAVEKAAMAPAVPAKGNSKQPVPPAAIKAMMQKIAAEQSKALANSTWVGRDFPDRARAMHTGDEAHSVIHGQATPAEAKSLADEGVPVAPLLIQVVPPEQKN